MATVISRFVSLSRGRTLNLTVLLPDVRLYTSAGGRERVKDSTGKLLLPAQHTASRLDSLHSLTRSAESEVKGDCVVAGR